MVCVHTAQATGCPGRVSREGPANLPEWLAPESTLPPSAPPVGPNYNAQSLCS